MASAALMLVVLWQRSPLLSAALVGPLLAISLYQRSAYQALRAMRLALTDPLTGLGNHRSFQERLQRELLARRGRHEPFTLCMIDVDDFKRINDLYGHPVGDRVLAQVGRRLRQNGEAFRLGGDEFALLLPGVTADEALSTASSVLAPHRLARAGRGRLGDRERRASPGSRDQAFDRDELIRLADSALYWAKEHGKNRVHVYRPGRRRARRARAGSRTGPTAPPASAPRRASRRPWTRVTRTPAATRRASPSCSAWIAHRLGLDRGAGRADSPRRRASTTSASSRSRRRSCASPARCTDPERLVLERHPQIGHRMLESLGVDPVAEWVLHHHERWDGTGYPDRLRGEEIPLGARIIFVADAYDAMTSDRAYRGRLTPRRGDRRAGALRRHAVRSGDRRRLRPRAGRPDAGTRGSRGLVLERDVAVLAARARLALRERRLQRVDQHGPRSARLDHVVHVAPLGGDVRVRELLPVVGDQLAAAARRGRRTPRAPCGRRC